MTLCTAAHQASLSFTISWSLLKLLSIDSMMSSKHLILSHLFLLLPSIFSSIKVFFNELALHQVAKLLEFQIQHQPSNGYSLLISFMIDCFDPLAAQGSLKSLLKHQSSKASVVLCSAFSMVQLSHPYMTTGKTIALTRWTFLGKVMSLLFHMLSSWS